jgi:hypothetical protein
MVEGQPKGRVVRSCFVGMTIGERLGLAEEQRSALFYALLLKDAGCSSTCSAGGLTGYRRVVSNPTKRSQKQ